MNLSVHQCSGGQGHLNLKVQKFIKLTSFNIKYAHGLGVCGSNAWNATIWDFFHELGKFCFLSFRYTSFLIR